MSASGLAFPPEAWRFVDYRASLHGTDRSVELERILKEWHAAGRPKVDGQPAVEGVPEATPAAWTAVIWAALREGAPLAAPGRPVARA